MRDYRISKQWPAVADVAVVPYDVFRHRVMDGWDARTAATTPARPYVTVLQRLWPLIEAMPGITTWQLRKRCPDLTQAQIYYAVRRNGGLSRTIVARGAKGQRPVYAVQVVNATDVVPEPPVRRRQQRDDYSSPLVWVNPIRRRALGLPLAAKPYTPQGAA